MKDMKEKEIRISPIREKIREKVKKEATAMARVVLEMAIECKDILTKREYYALLQSAVHYARMGE